MPRCARGARTHADHRVTAESTRESAGPSSGRGRRRTLAVLAAVVIAALSVLAFLASEGRFDAYPRRALTSETGRRAAPRWTQPCWRPAGRRVAYERSCARVGGRVVWVERDDPDGDGDRHLVLVSRFRLRIVKVPGDLTAERLPSIGAFVEAVGLVLTGASGRDEVRAEVLRRR